MAGPPPLQLANRLGYVENPSSLSDDPGLKRSLRETYVSMLQLRMLLQKRRSH